MIISEKTAHAHMAELKFNSQDAMWEAGTKSHIGMYNLWAFLTLNSTRT